MPEPTTAALVEQVREYVAHAYRPGRGGRLVALAALVTLSERLEAAERERDLIGAALDEPCAECGHIDWRSDGYADRFRAAEARLERALREIEADQHSWSPRPCRTCRMVSDALGKPFGCERYDVIHEAHTIMLRTGDPKKYRAALEKLD